MSSKEVDSVIYRVKTNKAGGVAIPPNSIGTSELVDGSVTEPKIATGAVTASKIATDAVTNDKMADNSVNTSEIINGAVTSVKLEASIQALLSAVDTGYTPIGANAVVTLSEARYQQIFIDSSGGGFTLTMPLTPLDGDRVVLVDENGSWDGNPVTVDMNSKNFLGNADQLLLDLNYNVVELVYYNGNYTVR